MSYHRHQTKRGVYDVVVAAAAFTERVSNVIYYSYDSGQVAHQKNTSRG